ncbi:MAG: hypothetical protein ACI4P8_00115 [Akkermansia sp.]
MKSRLLSAAVLLVLAAAALPLSALTLDELNERCPGAEHRGYATAFTMEGVQHLVLVDEQGTVQALIVNDTTPVRRSEDWGLEQASLTRGTSCCILLAEQADAPSRLLPGKSILGTLAYLIHHDDYSPVSLDEYGRLLWSTGKKKSVDFYLPLADGDKLRALELLPVGLRVGSFAAGVLARKLGCDDPGSEELARDDAAALLYRNRRIKITRLGKRLWLTALNKREPAPSPRLRYPKVSYCEPTPPAPEPTETPPEPTEPEAAPEPPPALSPAEARRAYIEQLRSL